jgi:amino acid adenylation domain-containing protein
MMMADLADIFGRVARQFGLRPAVIEGERCISYADLDLKSNEIASALHRIGISCGERVAIFRRKGIDTVAAIYGTLKAGCAYVPIDSKAGVDRLALILRDAGVRLVFTDPLLASQLEPAIQANSIRWVAGADDQNTLLKFRDHGGGPSVGGGAAPLADAPAAYVLYTSGSTGVPKGVEHTHSSAVAFASWAAEHFNISSNDRLSCHAPLNFDLTTFDLFAAMHKGACVVLIPDDVVLFPQRIAELIENQRITVWYSVPFALMQLTDRGNLGSRNLSALRHIIFAGERYPPAALRRLAALVPHARLTNLFGPTETNVCTFHPVTAEDLASDEFCPIGLPCPYASILICDPLGNPVSPGEPGELLVGGLSVMRGYLNRPELNAKVFFESGNFGKVFRTGDLVSASATGLYRFHGRLDRQVKVRGYRIDLEEIENTLLTCPGVTAAAAWIENRKNGLNQLAAAVAADSAIEITEEVLVRQMVRSLAQAAVPQRIWVLDYLPRTANGKIDYAALQESACRPDFVDNPRFQ